MAKTFTNLDIASSDLWMQRQGRFTKSQRQSSLNEIIENVPNQEKDTDI